MIEERGDEGMSVRSVDVRNTVARTQDVERVQRVQNDAAKAGQQVFAAELSRQAEEKPRQVARSREAEQPEIRDRREGSGKGSQGGSAGHADGGVASGAGGPGPGQDDQAGQAGRAGEGDEVPPGGRLLDVEV